MNNCICYPSYPDQSIHQNFYNPSYLDYTNGMTTALGESKSTVAITNDIGVPVTVYWAGIGWNCINGFVDGMAFVCHKETVQPGQTANYTITGYANTLFVRNPYENKFCGWTDYSKRRDSLTTVSHQLSQTGSTRCIPSIASDATCFMFGFVEKIPGVGSAIKKGLNAIGFRC